MSRAESELDIVNNLKTITLGKLRANKHKEHWRNIPIETLFNLLEEEVKELKVEIHTSRKPASIALECADIAAFYAMIIDNLGETE